MYRQVIHELLFDREWPAAELNFNNTMLFQRLSFFAEQVRNMRRVSR
jgi:hypothetical protein